MTARIGSDENPRHWHEHVDDVGGRLNWLRAAVLGANDGIVSTAGLVVGVAGATSDRGTILLAGVAGLAAGAMSMAAGEYVSVSTQRDSERSMLALEARELEQMPETELRELAAMYQEKGLEPVLAQQVAEQLTAHDALGAHMDIEFGIDPENLTNPWHAAWASMVAFTVGALLPLLVITLSRDVARVATTVAAVAVALAATGWTSAQLGLSPRVPAVIRNVLGGLLAMAVTYGIGSVVGVGLA